MKKSGIIATSVAGAAVLIGGGAWAATSMSSDPAASATPEPTATATSTPDAVADATTDPTPAASATPEYTESEQAFIPWARQNYEFYRQTTPSLPEMTDDELLEVLYQACEIVASSGDADPYANSVIPGFESYDDLDQETWEDDANLMFISAADKGYSTNGTTHNESYCD